MAKWVNLATNWTGYAEILAERVLSPLAGQTFPDTGCGGSLTVCAPCEGRKYGGELMVVGRAPNGWNVRFGLKQLPKCAQKIAELAFCESRVQGGECELAWASNELADSAFWRVIKGVVTELRIGVEADWHSQIAWSNLYKVAPQEGGNPSDKLCGAQHAGCVDLLADEFRRLEARRVLLITGLDWLQWIPRNGDLNFMSVVAEAPLQANAGPVELVLTRRGRKFVVTRRPERRNENDWIAEVSRALRDAQ